MRVLPIAILLCVAAAGSACPQYCDDGWHLYPGSNHCYKLGYWKTFWEARATCTSLGADLSSVTDAGENTFIQELAQTGITMSGYDMHLWIGLYYDGAEWNWTDGAESSYTNWRRDEPNYDAGRSSPVCVELLSDWESDIVDYMSVGQWNDIDCDKNMRAFVCKKAAILG